MNALFYKIAFLLLVASFISCDPNEIYEEEKYKKVIYLLSTSNQTYSEIYTLNEEFPVKYISVGCGGSLPNEEEVTIELEPDTVLLSKYNKSNFDIDSASFAKILPQDRYEIASMTVVLPANSTDQYVKVPVTVRPEGLSPDSIYFIPLAIKSVSTYEVNPDKFNMLYRVTIANDYAEQITTTYYHLKGTALNESTGKETVISGSKIVQPLTKDKVRMFAGSLLQTTTSKVPDINKSAIIVQVNEDQTVNITSYGTIEVEQLSNPQWNRYSIEDEEKYFYLNYRYSTLTTPATESNPEVRSGWTTVKETLRLLE